MQLQVVYSLCFPMVRLENVICMTSVMIRGYGSFIFVCINKSR
jgi:hypothetical protein